MPCTSGRANHTLLKKDCQLGCNCCINTTYSCQPICCKNDLFKNDCQDIVALFCNFFHDYVEENGCRDLCDEIFQPIANLDIGSSVEEFFSEIPNEHCHVTINFQQSFNGDVSSDETFEIKDLILINYEGPDIVITSPTLTVIINGKKCLECTAPVF